ncbi:MAG: hypothetical protein Q7T87_03620 [Polaromonas sp.]|nr:hypothetical protein [Polaromonas sp.]
MSDAGHPSFPDFGKMVPGFDFLQNLTRQAAGNSAQSVPQMPNLGSWVAPTLNVEELDKRIEELKAVQFWLDQNAMALKATIQALEVQKMTLATLRGMNFNMAEVANAFKLKVDEGMAGMAGMAGMGAGAAAAQAGQAAPAPAPAAAPAAKGHGFAGLEIPPTSYQSGEAEDASADDEPDTAAAPAASPSPGVVDPMQWWSALTQQFQVIATEAMKEAAKKTSAPAAKAAVTPADEALKTAASLAKGMADSGKAVADGARAAMNTALRSSQAWPMPGAASSRTVKKVTGAAGKAASPAAKKSPAKKAAAKAAVKKTAVKKAAPRKPASRR